MREPLEESWLNDDPLMQLESADQFGRAEFVDHIVRILGRVRKQSPSSTLALIGSWGAGKTTVLDELARQLSTDAGANSDIDEAWSVAYFNPWLYADTASLHAGFFAELRGALPPDRRWKRTRESLTTFGRRLLPLTVVSQWFGFNSRQLVEGVLDQLEPSTARRRLAVEDAMRKLDNPVLMIVDDLDRLSADELLHVFKLVRLVGRLPNVYYLLSYDEQTLIDLLGKTDLVAAHDGRRALDYLEKMVQIRLDMPQLRDYEVDRVVGQALARVVDLHEVAISPSVMASTLQRFDGVMSARIRTPRAIKRYFGQLDAFLGAVGPEVRFDDFVVITWLRTFEPGVYKILQAHKSELLDQGGDSLRRLHAPKKSNRVARHAWEDRLRESHVADAHIDDVLYLLSTLFPVLAAVYRGDDTEYGSRRTHAHEPQSGGILHPDYFDRFFAFGVPADDISDSAISAALAELASQNSGLGLAKLEETFAAQPELVIRKLWHRSETEDYNWAPVIRWFAHHYELMAQHDSLGHRVEAAVAQLFAKVPLEVAKDLVVEVSASDRGLYLIGSVQGSLADSKYGAQRDVEHQNEMGDALAPQLSELFRSRFARLVDELDSPLSASATLTGAKWWWQSVDAGGLRDVLGEARARGRWTLLDEAAWFVSGSVDAEGNAYISRFSDVTLLPEVFDMQQIQTELRNEIATAGSITSLRDTPATPEARRKFVLAVLKESTAEERNGS